MTPLRKKALVAGIFYVVTFISIPTLGMYSQVKNHTGAFILGSGSQNAVLFGCLLEVIVALAGIGTAVTLYPVIKRQNESAALGFVTLRVLEAAMIFTGVLSLVSIVTLRQTAASSPADAAALVTTGASHVATYKTTMLLGQTLMPAINGVLLGSLMYRSRLVPRIIPTMGLVGAPLLASAVVATLLGHNSPSSPWSALATLPIAAWEFSLGVRLIVKGFSPSPITASDAAPVAAQKELIPA
jgi:hypothetical protein